MKRVLFLLGQLNDLDIEWMISNGQKESIPAGEQLIKRNEEIENLYIILSGELTIRQGINDENEVARIGPGEIVGEMSFLESRPPLVSVTAMEPCTVFMISRELINDKLTTDKTFRSNFYYSLALFLSNRLRKTTSQLGYGGVEEADIIDNNVLDGVAQAGARFGKILQRFSEV